MLFNPSVQFSTGVIIDRGNRYALNSAEVYADQSIQAINILHADPLGKFLKGQNPHPSNKKMAAKPSPKNRVRKSTKAPPPEQVKKASFSRDGSYYKYVTTF